MSFVFSFLLREKEHYSISDDILVNFYVELILLADHLQNADNLLDRDLQEM
jgi:hypothetical protein